MTQERKPFIMPHKSRFAANEKRTDLFQYLDCLGLVNNLTHNLPIVTPPQKKFIFKCLKGDLAIPQSTKVEVHWFDNGTVFSQAKDKQGNPSFKAKLGKKKLAVNITFDKRNHRFVGIFYDKKLVSFDQVKHLT